MNNNFKIERPDHIVEVRQYAHEKQKKHLGKIKIYPGQTLWELNMETPEMAPVKYDVSAVQLDGSLQSEVITKEGYLYCVAINEKNAMKKFIRMCNKITDDCKGKTTICG